MGDCQPVLLAQSNDKLYQDVIAHAAAKLTIECVRGGLSKRESVDVIDRLDDCYRLEKRTPNRLRVSPQAFKHACSGSGLRSQLASVRWLLHLRGDVPHSCGNDLMVILRMGNRGCARRAFGSLQDCEL